MKTDFADDRIQKIAERVKELRINAGFTSYEKFAVDKNIDRKQYWRMEEGKTDFKISSLLRICDLHKMSVEQFFKELI